MNTKVTHKPIKLRNKFSLTETYYTFPHWDSRQIDGVEFIPVCKFYPSQEKSQQLHYMRKDSLEKVR
jgi:hypothetical protein